MSNEISVSKQTEPIVAHIDFDTILETLQRGVRRADAFMGIGLNAAEHDPPISHVLNSDVALKIRLTKEELRADERAHFAIEFGKWIRANGMRELLESFSIFMLQIYAAIFLLSEHEHEDDTSTVTTPRQFERKGIADQISDLSKVLTVSDLDIRIICSLNQMRNCYVHRLGMVGLRDVNQSTGVFNFLWTALQVEIIEPDGTTHLLPEVYDLVLKNGGTVTASIIEKSKTLQLGEELLLDNADLKEICLCVLSIGQRLFNQATKFARSKGKLIDKATLQT